MSETPRFVDEQVEATSDHAAPAEPADLETTVVPAGPEEPVAGETLAEEPVAAETLAEEPAAAEAPAEEPAAAEEPAEEVDPVEEMRAALRRAPGDWYVVHSYAGY